MSDELPPLPQERAVRVLRAKAAEWEYTFTRMLVTIEGMALDEAEEGEALVDPVDFYKSLTYAVADMALVMSLLADHIEKT